MDFQFTEEQDLFRNSISKVMQKDITIDYVRQCDETQEYPYKFYEQRKYSLKLPGLELH